MLSEYTPPEGGGLYIIWLNVERTRYYGGRSKSFQGRWAGHLQALCAGKHSNSRMQATFNKYGVFRPEVVQRHATQRSLVAAEQEWLDKNYGASGCVNLSPHATGGNIIDWTPEMRQKLSESHLGNTHSKATKAKMSKTRRTDPDLVAKARASLAQNGLKKGYKATDAHRRKVALAMAGKEQSQETKDTRAESHRGRKNTPETLALMSASAKARAALNPTSHGEETRALISAHQKGRVWINNGVKNRRVFPSGIPDEGWDLGRF